MGIDHFWASVPQQKLFVYTDGADITNTDGWLLLFRDGILAEAPWLGPTALLLIQGMYQAIGALADAGLHVIVDDVLYDPRVLQLAVDALYERNVLFVGVRCPLDVAVRREQERGDRAVGAAIFHSLVHAHVHYDLEVDTSCTSPQACAEQIKTASENSSPHTAFYQLRQRLS
ncbi:hypothetical protein BH10CHL1_BH10CHL1_46750 [soil metagenome]